MEGRGCLQVRGSERIAWKYDRCVCVDKWIQKSMCYLNALYMEKSEEHRQGDERTER